MRYSIKTWAKIQAISIFQELIDSAKISTADAMKTASKRAIQNEIK